MMFMASNRKPENAGGPRILALEDNPVYVRHGAAWALGEIQSQKVIAALRLALND